MSDTLPANPDGADALPLNERSSAFIDGVAFLNFVRLKSQLSPQGGIAEKSAATGAGSDEALIAQPADQEYHAPGPSKNATGEIEIQDEDWDSLFGAIEERLRGTVETLDSNTTQLAPQEKLSRIKSIVLDCVNSLDALHQALRHDRGLHVAGSRDRNAAGTRSALHPTGLHNFNRKN